MHIKTHVKVHWLITAFVILGTALANAQTVVKSNKLLPLDPIVRTGKLNNGFTYFIRYNDHPKNRVLFYLANKVGSVLENDDQQGLAHFMEHMNFNGTSHFPKNQLVDYLQKAGVRFGADINAYTSFDETVYQLPLPSDKPEILDNGIQIMRDWAQSALLDPTEIDKERGVVLEEKRLGKGAQMRMREKYLPILFNNSRYGRRLPIGLDTVLNNFKPVTLSNFYHDWYRPDLQALIVVGDIDVDKMEKSIKDKFSDLRDPANEKIRTKYKIKLTGQNHFITVTDKEQTSTNAEVIIKHKETPIKTERDYCNYIIVNLFNKMLGERYQELLQQTNPPFISGSGRISTFLAGIDSYTVNVVAKPGELENGFKAVWRETERLKRYGFTKTELARAKKSFLNQIQNSFRQKNTTYSEGYVNDYLQYFLNNVAAPGIEIEYALAKKELPEITLDMVNNLSKEYIQDTNRDIIIMAPDKDKGALPEELMVNTWMSAIDGENFSPYHDDFSNKPLLTKFPIPGKIIKEVALNGIEATELTLSNGARVILKPVNFIDNSVLFKAFSPGGTSLYTDADFQSAVNAAYLITSSGLGSYDFNHLNKLLSGSNILMGPYIADYKEGINAAAAPDELESLLQMTYLYFTHPRKDTIAFHSFITQSKARLANRKESPNSVFDDTVSAVMSNYSLRRTGPSLAKLSQINLDRSYEIFKERFADAANFTFTFVGDFDPKKLKPLIEKYLGSLPATHQMQQAKDLGIHPAVGKITKIVYKGIESKATVRLLFSGEYNYSPLNNMAMDALAESLQIRLLERLREEESGVYAPSAYVRYSKIPTQRYNLTISFGCAPKNVEKLIASALDEVNKLKTEGSTTVNLEKFKAENNSTHETNLKRIDFWSEYLTEQILNGENLLDVNKYDDNIQKLTLLKVKEAAKKYLSGDNLIRVVLMPENNKQ